MKINGVKMSPHFDLDKCLQDTPIRLKYHGLNDHMSEFQRNELKQKIVVNSCVAIEVWRTGVTCIITNSELDELEILVAEGELITLSINDFTCGALSMQFYNIEEIEEE